MGMIRTLLVANVAVLLAAGPSTRPALHFEDRPLIENSKARPAGTVVDHIMLHFCSDVIVHPDHPYDIDRQVEIFKNPKAPVSANYLIDREGKIYRFVPEERTAWHAGLGHLPWDEAIKTMNTRSVGIEMFAIGSPNDMALFGMKPVQYEAFKKKHPEWVGFTDAQYATLDQLVREIEARHPAIKHDRYHVIGHEEWAGRGRRTDPGELFDWTRIGLTRERPTPQPTAK